MKDRLNRLNWLFDDQVEALAGLARKLPATRDPRVRRTLLEECSVLLGMLTTMNEAAARAVKDRPARPGRLAS